MDSRNSVTRAFNARAYYDLVKQIIRTVARSDSSASYNHLARTQRKPAETGGQRAADAAVGWNLPKFRHLAGPLNIRISR